jgi:hypothetical protein
LPLIRKRTFLPFHVSMKYAIGPIALLSLAGSASAGEGCAPLTADQILQAAAQAIDRLGPIRLKFTSDHGHLWPQVA